MRGGASGKWGLQEEVGFREQVDCREKMGCGAKAGCRENVDSFQRNKCQRRQNLRGERRGPGSGQKPVPHPKARGWLKLQRQWQTEVKRGKRERYRETQRGSDAETEN